MSEASAPAGGAAAASTPDAVALRDAERRRELATLRSMSATEFVRSAGLTSTATVATHVLPIFGACLLTSIVRARYPRYAPDARPPPIPL